MPTRQSAVVLSVFFALVLTLTFGFGGGSQAAAPINTAFETRNCLDPWPPSEQIQCSSDDSAGAVVDTTASFIIPSGAPIFSSVVSFMPPDATYHEDTIPIGAMVSAFRFRATLGLLNSSCGPGKNTLVEYAFFNSSLDDSDGNLLHPSLPEDAGGLGTLETSPEDDGLNGEWDIENGYIDWDQNAGYDADDDGSGVGIDVIGTANGGAFDMDGDEAITGADDGTIPWADNNDGGPAGLAIVDGLVDWTNNGSVDGSDDGTYNGPALSNGVPAHAEMYPSYLRAMFDPDFQSLGPDGIYNTDDDVDGLLDPVTPMVRYGGYTKVSTMGTVMEYVIFAPGDLAAAFADPHLYSDLTADLGYGGVLVLNDPLAPDAPSAITDLCTVFSASTLLFGTSRDNPCTDGSADPYGGGCDTIGKLNNASTTGDIPSTLWSGTPDTCDGDSDESGCTRYRNPAANTGYSVDVYDGGVDIDDDGDVDANDDGLLLHNIIDGGVDIDDDGDVDANDDGTLLGFDVYDGGVDIDDNTDIDGDDDGAIGTGTHRYPNIMQSQRDADNDGLENLFDTCPYTPTTGYEPRTGDVIIDNDEDAMPGVKVIAGLLDVSLDVNNKHDNLIGPNDDGTVAGKDIINGYVDMDNDGSTPPDPSDDGVFLSFDVDDGYVDMDGDDSVPPDTGDDGTINGCDPTPNTNSGLGNHDLDVGGMAGSIYYNGQDNCPLAANGTESDHDNQKESELDQTWAAAAPNGGSRSDDIGDACDSEGGGSDTVANGHYHTFLNLGLQDRGGGYEAVFCIGGSDTDGDGVCDATEDALGSYKYNKASTPESIAWDYSMPLTNRGSGADDDSDGVPANDDADDDNPGVGGTVDDDAVNTPAGQAEEPFQSCNDDIDNDSDGLKDDQEADCNGAGANPDSDLDGIPDIDEDACSTVAGIKNDATKVPERLGNTVDDDGDTNIDNAQAAVSGSDCDGDGFNDDVEAALTWPAQVGPTAETEAAGQCNDYFDDDATDSGEDLTADLDNTQTDVAVTNGATFSVGDVIKVGLEDYIKITGIVGNTLTVKRGVPKLTHSSGDDVFDKDGVVNDGCPEPGLGHQERCGDSAGTNNENDDQWPADFNDDQKLNIADVNIFASPIMHFNQLVANHHRWDLSGSGTKINLVDVNLLGTKRAPMFYVQPTGPSYGRVFGNSMYGASGKCPADDLSPPP